MLRRSMVAGNGEGSQFIPARRSLLRYRSSFSWILICGACALMKEGQIGQSFVVPVAHSSRMPISRRGSSLDHRIPSQPILTDVASVMPREACISTSCARSTASMELRSGNEGTRFDGTRLIIEPKDVDATGSIAIERPVVGKGVTDSRVVGMDAIDPRVTNWDRSGGIDRQVPGMGDVDDGRGGVGGGGHGRGGGGEGGGDGEEEAGEELDIAAEGRLREKVVKRVDKAVRKGRIPKEYRQAYAQLLASPMMSLLCKNNGWRARLLGDSAFMTKLAIEMITGTVSQVLAEYQKRGKRFFKELEFVLADTLTCLFANFAAVWLSCPTVAVKASKKGVAKAGGALQYWLASCPTNAFQKVATEGGVAKSFSVYQRGAALVIPMPKLFVIGFGATLFGYGLIAGLEHLQGVRSKGAGATGEACLGGDEKPVVPVLGSSLAIGTFLAVSTNVRYQLIAGAVEQRFFDTMANPGLSRLGSTAVRSANLYIGSLTIVDWLRFVGLQH